MPILSFAKFAVKLPFLCTTKCPRRALTTFPLNVFDRQTKAYQRARACSRDDPSLYDYLRDESAYRLSDRLCDITRTFDKAVDLGCGRGYLSKFITSDSVKYLCQCDSSIDVLKQVPKAPDIDTELLCVDEEKLPFSENSLDLIISSLSLHWVNNLPNTISQVLRILKPDGCFLGVTFTMDTLFELRVALQLAEQERLGGFFPHTSPFVESSRFGELLKEQGLSLISLDVDEIVVHYPSMFELIEDLRGMGESNAVLTRPLRVSRDVLFAAAAIYDDRFGVLREGSEIPERCVPATFRLLNFIAWKPDPSQAQPLRPGTGEFSLKDLSQFDELNAKISEKLKNNPPKQSEDL